MMAPSRIPALASRIPGALLVPVALLAGVLLGSPAAAQAAGEAGVATPGRTLQWDGRAVEHLLNRAGFGSRPGEIRRWVKAGPEALVAHLLAPGQGDGEEEPFFAERILFDPRRLAAMEPEQAQRVRVRIRQRNRRQQLAFLGTWVDRMLEGEDPLRERMTLFWHGFFTSSGNKVRTSFDMIRQNELLREHALGNYGDLLDGILRDGAMLIYLDNVSNRRGKPNENLARELMELFSLGEGNYSEWDVREMARALTGYAYQRNTGFTFIPREHDFGRKTLLGVTGRHDATDVVEILLDQPACGRWVAGRLIEYLEGVAPDPERLEGYASFLREHDYELAPFLERLFLDPDFYRDEIIGARVLSPIDYLVGSCRRLGITPHPNLIVFGAAQLGEQLFEPPNVKGWEGGPAWITTSTLMNRGNLMGMLLGMVGIEDLRDERLPAGDADERLARAGIEEVLGEEPAATMAGAEAMQPEMAEARVRTPGPNDALVRILRMMDGAGYQPRIHLTARLQRRGVSTDREIVDELCEELLAIDAPTETRRVLTAFLREQREALGIEAGELLEHEFDCEQLLRRLAHLIFSLPEAQLG